MNITPELAESLTAAGWTPPTEPEPAPEPGAPLTYDQWAAVRGAAGWPSCPPDCPVCAY